LFQCHSRVWMASGPKAPNPLRWLSWSLTKSVVKQGNCKGPKYPTQILFVLNMFTFQKTKNMFTLQFAQLYSTHSHHHRPTH
jgi:hypothetical protein